MRRSRTEQNVILLNIRKEQVRFAKSVKFIEYRQTKVCMCWQFKVINLREQSQKIRQTYTNRYAP